MSTLEEYDIVLSDCRKVYILKMKDYGPSWRIMRPQTVNDQLFIKAKRIRTIEMTGVNLVGEEQLKATDYCGVKSGRDEDKFAACGLTPVAVPGFSAPAIGECPLYLACRVQSVQELGSHDLFLGVIERVGVKPGVMDDKGRLDYGKMKLVAYNHGNYYALGQALGFFGYSVAAPDVLERRMKELK